MPRKALRFKIEFLMEDGSTRTGYERTPLKAEEFAEIGVTTRAARGERCTAKVYDPNGKLKKIVNQHTLKRKELQR